MLPYPGHPYARTHPDHLSRLAPAFATAPPDACTVLELACGDGLNVIAMAAAAPGVRVTGVDVDAEAIARGRAVVDALGLGDRVELLVADLLALPALEPADYVICHGLYTWVPARVADAALAAMGELLRGVGFLSFNLRPGWAVRRALGPALARSEDARGRLAALEPAAGDAYGALLTAERDRLLGLDEPLLVHDDLGPHTTAAWHDDVVDHAAFHGLRVAGDAHPDAPATADQGLADLLSGVPYREVALVPAGAPEGPGWPAPAPRFTLTPGEAPVAFALARLQARSGTDVTTLRHTRLRIPDATGRAILVACDGTRDRAALAARFGAEVTDVALRNLAANALLLPAARRSPAA